MSTFDGAAELAEIKARLAGITYPAGWVVPVYEDIPDAETLARWSDGSVKPYIFIDPVDPIPRGRDRGLGVGEEKQPHLFPFMVSAYANTREAARELATIAGNLLVGWQPNTGGNATPIKGVSGGFRGSVADIEGKPSRFYRTRIFDCVINLAPSD